MKGVARSEDDTVVFSDNCVDIVPGETVLIGVKGLKKGEDDKVGVRYLGL
jgi:beta-mannosidase